MASTIKTSNYTTDCSYINNFATTSTSTNPNLGYSIKYDTILANFYEDLKQHLKFEDQPSLLAVQVQDKKVDLTDDFLQKHKEQNVRFKKVIERNPDRVYEFIFQDDTHIKTICAEEDLGWFSLEYAFYLALAKYLYGKQYTLAGVMSKIADLMCDKYYIKIVKEGMKIFKEDQKAKEKVEKEKEKIKAIKHNRHLKNERRKAMKKNKENENLKRIIKEAIEETK